MIGKRRRAKTKQSQPRSGSLILSDSSAGLFLINFESIILVHLFGILNLYLAKGWGGISSDATAGSDEFSIVKAGARAGVFYCQNHLSTFFSPVFQDLRSLFQLTSFSRSWMHLPNNSNRPILDSFEWIYWKQKKLRISD